MCPLPAVKIRRDSSVSSWRADRMKIITYNGNLAKEFRELQCDILIKEILFYLTIDLMGRFKSNEN